MYEYDDKTVRTDIQAQIGDVNGHFARLVAEEVTQAMNELGYAVDLIDLLSAKPGSELHDRDMGITPDFPDRINDELYNSFKWLAPPEQDQLDWYDGDENGNAGMTAWVVHESLTITEVLRKLANDLDDDGMSQLDKLRAMIGLVPCDLQQRPEEVMAYAFFRWGLGWYAERIITDTDDWSKGSVAHDDGGIDMFGTGSRSNGNGYQLKPVTVYASGQPRDFRRKSADHMFYMWLPSGLVMGDLEEMTSTNGGSPVKAKGLKESNVSTITPLVKSESVGPTKDYHRPARILWS